MLMQTIAPPEAVALTLPKGMAFDEFMSVGRGLLKQHRTIPFFLGDWARFGRSEYGDQFALALPDIADPKVIKLAERVSNAFLPEQRDQALSFDHYRHLVDLPHGEAKRLLDKAKQEHLPANQLRTEALRVKVELGQGDFVDDDAEHQEFLAMQRAWNNGRPEARAYFLEAANGANLGLIDA